MVKMLSAHHPKFVRITVLLLFLCLLTWDLGPAITPFPAGHGLDTANPTASAIQPGPERLPPQTKPADQPALTPTVSQASPDPQPPQPASPEPLFPTEKYQAGAAGTPTTASGAAPILAGDFAADVVLVRFASSITGGGIEHCLKSANATLKSQIKEIYVWQVIVPTGQVAEAITSLSVCAGVSYAEPDYIARMTDTLPTDPDWGNQYGLLAIHAPHGWDINTGSPAVTIAIVDTGVDLGHVDLAAKIVPGYDFVNDDAVPQDDNGHGTHVAGIAAAITNNAIGVAGVSWGACIMPVKVLDADGSSTAWFSFTILPKPGAFNKSSPANGTNNQPSSLTLK